MLMGITGAPVLTSAQEGLTRKRGRPKKIATTAPVARAVPEVVVYTPARNARAAPVVDGEGDGCIIGEKMLME